MNTQPDNQFAQPVTNTNVDLVFTGAVSAVTRIGIDLGPYPNRWREGPNLWRPDDCAVPPWGSVDPAGVVVDSQ